MTNYACVYFFSLHHITTASFYFRMTWLTTRAASIFANRSVSQQPAVLLSPSTLSAQYLKSSPLHGYNNMYEKRHRYIVVMLVMLWKTDVFLMSSACCAFVNCCSCKKKKKKMVLPPCDSKVTSSKLNPTLGLDVILLRDATFPFFKKEFLFFSFFLTKSENFHFSKFLIFLKQTL